MMCQSFFHCVLVRLRYPHMTVHVLLLVDVHWSPQNNNAEKSRQKIEMRPDVAFLSQKYFMNCALCSLWFSAGELLWFFEHAILLHFTRQNALFTQEMDHISPRFSTPFLCYLIHLKHGFKNEALKKFNKYVWTIPIWTIPENSDLPFKVGWQSHYSIFDLLTSLGGGRRKTDHKGWRGAERTRRGVQFGTAAVGGV